MVGAHCIQYEQTPPIHLQYITTNIQNVLNNGHGCYCWYIVVVYIASMHQASIVVDCCSKYRQHQPFISEISQQIQKCMKTIVIITQMWHIAKC